ncbi:MAG: patatin-like phospholipase family protein [Myxococcota bacterium]
MLSGGGARGAYEVGVLRYVRERIRCPTPFHCITGSSVGAINGAYIAATCDRPRAQVRMLARVWSDLNLDEIYRLGWSQIRNLPQLLFGRTLPRKMTHGETIGGLVDPTMIESVVRTRITWRGITDNLHRGHLQAFSCSATELATGTTTVFVQTREGRLPFWPADPGQTIVHTPIMAAHTLASAAIPVLFPAVRVGDQFYVDGSLRQNTPIRPAMRLGANRLLVIGLRQKDAEKIAVKRARDHARAVYPNAVFMLGKVLNALMLDKLEADLTRIRRTNELVEAGRALYGEDFAEKIGAQITGRAGKPYEKIDVELIQPSRNLGELAYDVIRRTGLRRYSSVMARWLRRTMESGEEFHENDLASYVLWDPAYVGELMDLGFADAQARHDEIAALFEPVR